MTKLNIIAVFATVSLALSATSQALASDNGPGVINNPIKNASVAGRTYCGVTTTLTNLTYPRLRDHLFSIAP